MVELENIPPAERERLETLRGADVIIGILTGCSPVELEATLGKLRESLAQLPAGTRAVLIHSGDHIEAPEPEPGVRTLAYPLLTTQGSPDPAQSIAAAYRSLIAVGNSLGAKAVGAIVSDLESINADWLYRLLQPVLQLDFDLVAPCYGHRPLEGLLNGAILAPFTSALYGKQIQHPLGPDFAFSRRLIEHLAASTPKPPHPPRSLASLAVEAICNGFEICQAYVGVRRYPPPDWMNQSSVLAQVLSPVFVEAELRAAYWQRIRGSLSLPVFGAPEMLPETPDPVDVRRMIESFELGCRNLQDIWGLVLPPGTLLQLSRLARSPLELFRMPDTLWARIIYDFALGHRLRLISQEHVLRAMTPLYLAWVASHALEIGPGDPIAAAHRLEDLALAFETSKPYVVSRWRWPDRFNP